jgi:hypothetical protein
MKKIFVLTPFILLALVLLLSVPCDKYLSCTGSLSGVLSYPGQWFVILIPLSLFALVLKDEKHKYWLKFTGVFFVVSMILVYLMPEYDPGIVSMDRELTNWFLAGVYSFVSLIYFVVQLIKSRKSNNNV